MKWQNLTNRICGSIFALSILANIIPITAASAQKKDVDAPLLLKKCWVSKFPESADHLFASDNDSRLFISKGGGKVVALDLRSGDSIWQSDFGGNVVSGLIEDQTSLFFATNSGAVAPAKPASSLLRSISRQTGIVSWTSSLPFSETIYISESGENLLAVGSDGWILAIRKSDGGVAWHSQSNKKLTSVPWFREKSVVFSVEPGEIVIISPSDGRIVFQMKTDSLPTSLYLPDDNTMIWGDKKGNLAAVDTATKQVRWKFKNGAQVSGITPAGKSILVTSYDNFVYLMSPIDGKISWKRRLAGRVAEKPLVTPTFAVITIVGEAGASFLDMGSGKLINRLSLEDEDHIIGTPVAAGSSIIFSKGDGIYSYSAGDCISKEEKRGD